jgi:hypothetical protein
MLWSFLCLSQVRTCTSNVICYDLFCVCHKSGPEPLTSYVMVFFVSVTIQDLNLKRHMWWSILCLSQVRTWTSNVVCYGLFVCLSQVRTRTSKVICYGLFCVVIGNPLIYWIKIIIILTGLTQPHFCVCHKSGPEPLMSYVMVFFVSVTSQSLNL